MYLHAYASACMTNKDSSQAGALANSRMYTSDICGCRQEHSRACRSRLRRRGRGSDQSGMADDDESEKREQGKGKRRRVRPHFAFEPHANTSAHSHTCTRASIHAWS